MTVMCSRFRKPRCHTDLEVRNYLNSARKVGEINKDYGKSGFKSLDLKDGQDLEKRIDKAERTKQTREGRTVKRKTSTHKICLQMRFKKCA